MAGVPRTGGPADEDTFPWLLVLLAGLVGGFSLALVFMGPRGRTRTRPLRLLAALMIVASGLASGFAGTDDGDTVAHPSGRAEMPKVLDGRLAAALRAPVAPAPLYRPGLDLRAPPVDVPLELRIPDLGLTAGLLGVGLTSSDVMDAPMGRRDDPVWQKAFWYRGGGIPGDVGTATIAGHVSGGGGPALFANLSDLRRGNVIIVRDERSGLDARFAVTETRTYSLQQAEDVAVLSRIYGAGPVMGRGPQAAPDGVSHLTLITCARSRIGSSYDRRTVVYAERIRGSVGRETLWENS